MTNLSCQLLPRSTWELKISLYVPYIDSLIQSPTFWFSPCNAPENAVISFNHQNAKRTTHECFVHNVKLIKEFYNWENIAEEGASWYEFCKIKEFQSGNMLASIWGLEICISVFPAIQEAIILALSLPSTMCTAEHSFSTLRWVKRCASLLSWEQKRTIYSECYWCVCTVATNECSWCSRENNLYEVELFHTLEIRYHIHFFFMNIYDKFCFSCDFVLLTFRISFMKLYLIAVLI